MDVDRPLVELGRGDDADTRARKALADAAAGSGLDLRGGFVVRASSRVCLSVEHGDYNGTALFGTGLDRFLWIAAAPNGTQRARWFSPFAATDGVVEFDLRELAPIHAPGWPAFARGSVYELRRLGFALDGGFDAVVHSEIPGGGMSRSAALSLALLLAASRCNGHRLADRMQLARAAQRVENEHVGSPCGLLDPLVVAHARANCGVLYDPADDEVRDVAFGGPADAFTLLALDTGRSRHGLANATYPHRRRECEAMLARLQRHLPVRSLAEAVASPFADRARALLVAQPDWCRRFDYLREASARFPRLVAAFARGDVVEIGACFRADGISLRDDYAISGPELETMCDLVRGLRGVHGERMLGGGDCGASGALVDPTHARPIADHVRREYPTRHPAFAATFAVHACRTAEGLAFLDLV